MSSVSAQRNFMALVIELISRAEFLLGSHVDSWTAQLGRPTPLLRQVLTQYKSMISRLHESSSVKILLPRCPLV